MSGPDYKKMLDWALDAFDTLEAATCGGASVEDLRTHYGLSGADRVVLARSNIATLRATIAARPDEAG